MPHVQWRLCAARRKIAKDTLRDIFKMAFIYAEAAQKRGLLNEGRIRRTF